MVTLCKHFLEGEGASFRIVKHCLHVWAKVPSDSDSESTVTVGEEEWGQEEPGDLTDHPHHVQLLARLFVIASSLEE